jgi:CheY-like chemotaxis protein
MRILIAEDHPDNREMLTRRLERRGYEVHVANNGAEAVEKAKSCDPDLILMDISMPVMSGIEATRVLRQTPELSHIKIVALTAHAMESARHECLAAGCDDFATKPVDFAGLVALIQKYDGLITR